MMPRVMESSNNTESARESKAFLFFYFYKDIYIVSLYSTISTLPNVFLSMVFVKALGGRKSWALAYFIEAIAMLSIFILEG